MEPHGSVLAERAEREVAESAILFLAVEMASSMRERLGPEVAMAQLDAVGFSTGTRLATRLAASRFPITTQRNVMKWVFKEFWTLLFRKAATRVQTDRRNNYIVQDSCFRWLEQFAPPPGGGPDAELRELALLHLALPCGIIRGALFAMGVPCSVTVEVVESQLPACTFTVTLANAEGTKDVAAV
mmetsp:Transcript_114821/g.245121  ORF Transcript_114821/g.245121 Transcript_114821/m.245121 type:complete len:185 (+) Transcript_114821:80-634(+)|eukprot:CAMPEP_0180422604 /NCGR_PEP_ID=MMETSP1036_2-20121128/3761_1 /TAXON_ID=632150 /ORGANISM="Azadinium spinosum, Strain 3D9" /LENGTH=184 /DNA_ID=CAMNT_0022427923 /DNA_START=77 /DNA_END=631 /DNA_ORIENTATION=+